MVSSISPTSTGCSTATLLLREGLVGAGGTAVLLRLVAAFAAAFSASAGFFAGATLALKRQCHEIVVEVRPWSGSLALN
jgi:hypothetical protein